MDAEKRDPGLRYRVDKVLHDRAFLCRQPVVLAAVRHDPEVDIDAHHRRKPIRHEAAADNKTARLQRLLAIEMNGYRIGGLVESLDLGTSPDLAAEFGQPARHGSGHQRVIDDAAGW